MEDFQYLSANENYAESSLSTPPSRQNGTRSSGITLVLPPLKLGRPVKGGKKVKSKNGSSLQDPDVRKIPRPVKLKPLKEVLTKLITQIKKKDDYAFFISPVDPAQIPGYADVVKRPMDLGTMSAKVSHSRYRSLEEFTADFRLVTSNAKTFNPPGTIYHSEADRIEVWGLDHISKAAGTVIEYETDWNIEIEQDDEAALNVDDDDDGAHTMTPMDVDGSAAASPAPSLMTPVTQTKRGPRGPYKKGAAPTISESIDAEGRLPGSKDGLGAFPPESDWAKMMLSLKLKGKRYRTKKERLRMEKGGPPYCPDGSLDYTEMEDPFSILSSLVPDSPCRPQLTPLYPPLPPEGSSEGSIPPPISAPLKRPFLEISTTTKDTSSVLPNKRRRHWTIMRNAPARGKVKEKDDEGFIPAWKVPREPNNTDYGSFGTLVGEVAEESGANDISTALGSENGLFSAIRSSVESKISDSENGADAPSTGDEYWTDGRAVEAEQYITDIVFGGVDGWAYVRSLAAFVEGSDLSRQDDVSYPLGKPLVDYVSDMILDPITEGRHSVLREIAAHLYDCSRPISPSLSSQLSTSLTIYPPAFKELRALRQIYAQQLEMATLIRGPAELFVAENEWAGASYKEERRKKMEQERERALEASLTKNAAEYLALAIKSHKEDETPTSNLALYEGPDVMDHALTFSADAIMELSGRIGEHGPQVKAEPDVEEGGSIDAMGAHDEDPSLRKIRLNLLALAKRAPLDKIANLPADLVPPHIRNYVPTI